MTTPSIKHYRQKLSDQGLSPDEIERRILLASSFTGWIQNKQVQQTLSTNPPPSSANSSNIVPTTIHTRKHTLYALAGVSLAILMAIGMTIARIQQNPSTIKSKASYKPNTRTLSFSGKLTDANGFIIANKTKVVLALYNDALGGKQVYSSGACTVTPNMQGSFQTTIGGACGSPIREDVFTANPQLYLGIKIGNDPEMQPRTPLSTQNAVNNAITNDLAVNDEGEIVLSSATAAIRSTLESANFAITSARGVVLQSSLDGDVTLSATESGQIKFLVGGEQVGIIKAGGELAITGNIIPSNTGIQDLGSSNNRFNSLYVENIYPGLSGISGYLKREGNTLSTTNAGDELILGSSVASLARIRLSPYTSDKSWINAGNFGIGTTNPTFNLDVVGTTRIGGDLTLGASGSQRVNFNTSTLSFANASGIALPGNTVNALAFQTDLLSLDTKNNRMGIGTIAPTNKLTVIDSQANLSTLKIENTNGDASSKGLLIKLGFTGGGNTTNEFVTFVKGNNEVQGKIQSNGASGVSFTSGGGDFAEYFLKDARLDSQNNSHWNTGTLMCLVADGMVRPCDTTYTNVLGVTSSNAAFVGNSQGEDNEKYTLVGLVGQLPVKVSPISGTITSGDPLSYSTTPGEVSRATRNMKIVGFAQESYNGIGAKTIRATIQPGYYEITQKDQLAYDGTVLGTNREGVGELISRFSNLIAKTLQVEEKISSPVVETGSLVAKNAQIETMQPKTILPAPKSDLVINLAPNERESTPSAATDSSQSGPLAKLIIQGFNNQTVASFDALGNATLSGTLQTQSIDTQSVDAQDITTQSFSSSQLLTKEASVSGTLIANRIEAGNITDIEKMVHELKNASLPDARLYEKDTSVFNSIGPIDDITVLNKASFYDVSVANSLMAGSVSIKDDTITGLAFELKLTALASINLLDGAVIIARDGTLTTKGEVIAQKGIRTNHLSAINKSDNITVSLGKDASHSGSLQILNEEAREVASITASGSAYFGGGIGVNTFIADSNNVQNKSSLTAAISTNAQSAGTGEIPAGKSNIIIYNEKLSKNSLVYLTSTSKTQNQPVYVSEKKSCETPAGQSPLGGTPTPTDCKNYFVVTIDSPIQTAATFNWWIIN